MTIKTQFSINRSFNSEVIISPDSLKNLNSLGAIDFINKSSKHFLLTDKNVEKLYSRRVIEALEHSGREVRTLVVPASESSKSFKVYAQLAERALDYGFDKNSFVFSLGGGVVNNLAGFLASTLYRGIGLVHFPTSLLAQVDAAIDFKQAINFDHGKNLIGSYYPASKIIVDPTVLKTLDIRLIRDGLAEAVKHALCQDSSFLEFISNNSNNLLDQSFLYEVVKKSIELKLKVMNQDYESEYDETVKQYGHVVGHAIEHISDGEVFHGESIAIGMCVAAEVSHILHLTDEETVEKHYNIFNKLKLPCCVPVELSHSDIWGKIRYDKHFQNDGACMGLIRTPGVMAELDYKRYSHYITPQILFEAIEKNRRRFL